jgi:hypothetical protein
MARRAEKSATTTSIGTADERPFQNRPFGDVIACKQTAKNAAEIGRALLYARPRKAASSGTGGDSGVASSLLLGTVGVGAILAMRLDATRCRGPSPSSVVPDRRAGRGIETPDLAAVRHEQPGAVATPSRSLRWQIDAPLHRPYPDRARRHNS